MNLLFGEAIINGEGMIQIGQREIFLRVIGNYHKMIMLGDEQVTLKPLQIPLRMNEQENDLVHNIGTFRQ
jgi:hypothetical protein